MPSRNDESLRNLKEDGVLGADSMADEMYRVRSKIDQVQGIINGFQGIIKAIKHEDKEK